MTRLSPSAPAALSIPASATAIAGPLDAVEVGTAIAVASSCEISVPL
jgi:hypothetical protein